MFCLIDETGEKQAEEPGDLTVALGATFEVFIEIGCLE